MNKSGRSECLHTHDLFPSILHVAKAKQQAASAALRKLVGPIAAPQSRQASRVSWHRLGARRQMKQTASSRHALSPGAHAAGAPGALHRQPRGLGVRKGQMTGPSQLLKGSARTVKEHCITPRRVAANLFATRPVLHCYALLIETGGHRRLDPPACH